MPIHDHKDSIEIGESIRIHHFDIRVIMSNEISSEGRDMSVFRPGFCLIILIFQLILFSSRSIETRISRPGPRFRQSITVLGIFKHFKKLTLTKTILKSKSDRPRINTYQYLIYHARTKTTVATRQVTGHRLCKIEWPSQRSQSGQFY